ncbi:hypothetical protein NUW58_g2784 [Xylaria curta]|uniref:Uncharacterized protein n=1 Tax=Xylaria curta TaxID=42375 RepID=A0ACC1PGM2_9PEZI|nr:hypothetical protein NUW58_g2784 [Xylaria curta]
MNSTGANPLDWEQSVTASVTDIEVDEMTQHEAISSQEMANASVVVAKAEDMFVYSDIDFSPLINDALYAMMATPNDNAGQLPGLPNTQQLDINQQVPPNLPDSFHALPVEVLMNLVDSMSAVDRATLALAYPQHFMNDNRLNIFTADAYAQLRIPTYEPVTHAVELERGPLIIRVITEGRLAVDQIGVILGQYERVCLDNNIDRHTFLNSMFPDNTPAGMPPNVASVREVYSCLHAAVQATRLDLIEHFIQRGANVHRVVSTSSEFGSHRLTPYQYAVRLAYDLRRSPAVFDAERFSRLEETAIALAYTSPCTALRPDLRPSYEMRTAIRGGIQRLAVHLLERLENTPNINRTSLRYRNSRGELLSSALRGFFPVPRVVTFLLETGVALRDLPARIGHSFTQEGLRGHPENAVVSFEWELQNQSPNIRHAMTAVYEIATDDRFLIQMQALAGVIINFNDTNAQTGILLYALIGGIQAASESQNWLLRNLDANALNGTALRVAIRHRSSDAVAFILRSLVARGESIDATIAGETYPSGYNSYWNLSPLTYALEQQSYAEAAILLSFGADVNTVPANIRHRVRVIHQRLRDGAVDPVHLVYRGTRPNNPVTRNEAVTSLDYVFGRLLFDLRYPLPAHYRNIRRPEFLFDDPANDSDSEQEPMENDLQKLSRQ